jgi:hypothetical protein
MVNGSIVRQFSEAYGPRIDMLKEEDTEQINAGFVVNGILIKMQATSTARYVHFPHRQQPLVCRLKCKAFMRSTY